MKHSYKSNEWCYSSVRLIKKEKWSINGVRSPNEWVWTDKGLKDIRERKKITFFKVNIDLYGSRKSDGHKDLKDANAKFRSIGGYCWYRSDTTTATETFDSFVSDFNNKVLIFFLFVSKNSFFKCFYFLLSNVFDVTHILREIVSYFINHFLRMQLAMFSWMTSDYKSVFVLHIVSLLFVFV